MVAAPPLRRSPEPVRSSSRNLSALGFRSQPKELPRTRLRIEGDVPTWLRGTLLRTGPGTFEAPSRDIEHWFMGLAMLVRLRIGDEPGVAEVSAKHLKSHARERAMRPNPFPRLRALAERIRPFLGERPTTDDGSVNVARIGDAMVAMTETTRRARFDPTTLEALGTLEHRDVLEGHLTTAHPHWDAKRGCHFNYMSRFGPKVVHVAYRMDAGRRHLLRELETDRPAYMHSFGATPNHLIFVEGPPFVQPLKLRFLTADFFSCLTWDGAAGTRIRAVHKDSGAVQTWHLDEPLFTFHTIDGRETGDSLELDLITYPDSSVLQELVLERLRSEGPPKAIGAVRRIRLPSHGPATIDGLDVPGLELPRIDPRRAGDSRMVYGVTNDLPGTFVDGLVKVDRAKGTHTPWRGDGLFPGEPIFVPDPRAASEDEGVVISLVLDGHRERSLFVVLDAKSFTERARIELPLFVPQGFHGEFFAD
ncbi:MAG: carotenoid oxygenase family protein [Deltaproteobacteria bacterium]|nr:carotenoid oxygenase family protein [Deltaproteobacteria bacterium]